MTTTEAELEFTPPVQDKNLDMVRNILFGEQARENEKRLANLERFVKVWTNSVRDEMRKNMDSINHEIHMLQDLLDQEAKARMGDGATFRKHFEQNSKGIENLQRQLQTCDTDLSQRIEQESKLLSQVMDEQRQELLNQIKQAAEQLRQDKTDRKMLASLLANVSHQLAGDKV
ncbi:hypothetical protein [Thiothrix lacustris]|uniref:Uncharacterized protein n=1 Tax=Thiothrix lacustris TaxID=525917 RepID=A0ABY9MLK8_9GAMM|nr:hypothetical protein [Thiothrix lacustris]WML89545.1 hypothetical protein RCF98_11240 [Thiothrix lacustris]WMP18909.1 hypothetical protein RCS87_07555 [Thiothrix lacustris]